MSPSSQQPNILNKEQIKDRIKQIFDLGFPQIKPKIN